MRVRGENAGTIHNAAAGFTYTVSGILEVRACPECGVLHGVPIELVEYADRHRPCYPIHCPNGHKWGYGGSSYREQLEAERGRSGRLAAQRDQAEASGRAHKAAATRARNERDRLGQRAKAGVCPCCGRSFKQLRRHMTTKHPEYDPADQ